MKSIALHSLKGGVGKTTAAVNLAWQSARQGYRTLLWDLDPQGAASLCLRVPTGLSGGVSTLLGVKQLGRLIKPTGVDRLSVLPADFSLRLIDVELERAKRAKKRIGKLLAGFERFDVVIIDTPPGSGLLTDGLVTTVDVLLVPVVPSPLSVQALNRSAAYFSACGYQKGKQRAFFSMVDQRRKLHRELLRAHAGTGSFLTTAVPASADIERMGALQTPVRAFTKRNPATLAFEALWAEAKASVGLTVHPHAGSVVPFALELTNRQ